MFSFLDSKSPTSKAYVSRGALPPYVRPEQPPSKKAPFSTISSQPFTHTVHLTLPQELYHVVWKDIEAKITNIQYSRVIMSLSELLEGDFFDKYIKIGNVLMLSEGRPGVDDRYSLRDGILRLELAKDKYERCGLVGQPIRDAGRKHIKSRYAVEMNLRSPSMLHGKKGFERIVWAFKNVLNHSVAWLFHDFHPISELETTDAPIAKHHPVTKECSPQLKIIERVRIPNLDLSQSLEIDDDFEDWALEIYEWLSLVAIESPRILSEDVIDPFLSRYQLPDNDSGKACSMVTLTWAGLIPASWIMHLFIHLSRRVSDFQSARPNDWKGDFFALSAFSFKTAVADQQDAFTILCLSDESANGPSVVVAAAEKASGDLKTHQRHGKEYILWELNCG